MLTLIEGVRKHSLCMWMCVLTREKSKKTIGNIQKKTKNNEQNIMGQGGFMYKSSRDYHIKCGERSLVMDIHLTMILSYLQYLIFFDHIYNLQQTRYHKLQSSLSCN